jgi:hypothetical protein
VSLVQADSARLEATVREFRMAEALRRIATAKKGPTPAILRREEMLFIAREACDTVGLTYGQTYLNEVEKRK